MNTKPLTLTVTFQARPGKEAELLDVLTGLLAPTRAEAGCINYDLHIAADDPSKFLFYENWASKAHHEAHDKTPHIQNLRARINEISLPPVKTFWEKIA
ncbi:MAG TPA: putative quinol monooxygenase [Verrucomicrobiae bacterium]|jgi:quinol monooxygenase YgiN